MRKVKTDQRNVTKNDLLRVLDVRAGPSIDANALLHATFYWDHPQASADAFCDRLNQHDWRAVARLVEALGLFRSTRLLGSVIWYDYPIYSKFIHPALERGLRRVWQLQKNLGLI